MYEQGFYWVRIAHFTEWTIAHFNGSFWKIVDDGNEWQSIDFNVIRPNKLNPPV